MAKSRTVKETGVASGDQANIERLTPNRPVRFDVQRGGKRYSGEAVLAPTWSAELGGPPAPDEAFRIVLLETPDSFKAAEVLDGRVVVNVPAEAALSINEPVAEYRTGARPRESMRSDLRLRLERGTVLVGGVEGTVQARPFWTQEIGVLVSLALLADFELHGPQIGHMRAYLELAAPPESDEELFLDRLSLQEQLHGSARANPAVWSSVQAMFEGYKARYAAAYIRHHRAYRTETGALQRALRDAQGRAKALKLLNTVEELGSPVGEAAVTAAEGLLERTVPCDRPEQDPSRLVAEPRCGRCGVGLDAAPATQIVRRALRALDEALAQQHRRLGSEAVRQVLDQPGSGLERFVQVVQAADPSALDQVMNEDLAGFLRRLLGERTIEVSLSGLTEKLRADFPDFEEGDAKSFGLAMQGLLEQAFEEAREVHPGKRIRLKLR